MKFIISGIVIISTHTEVEAESEERARELAEDRSMITLCHQCASGDRTEEWITSGELDGIPTIQLVEREAE